MVSCQKHKQFRLLIILSILVDFHFSTWYIENILFTEVDIKTDSIEIEVDPKNIAFLVKDGALYSCQLVKAQMAYILPDKDKCANTLLLYPPAKDVPELYLDMSDMSDDVSIAESAFCDSQLKKIVIEPPKPATDYTYILRIYDKAFKNCKQLSELEFRGSKALSFKGREIFEGCDPNLTVKFDDIVTTMTPNGFCSKDGEIVYSAPTNDDYWGMML